MKKKQVLFADICIVSVILLLGIMAKTVLFYVDFPECIFLKRGILCGSCGGTRCVYNFLQGNFFEAFRLNSFVFLLIIYLIFLAALLNIRVFIKNKVIERMFAFLISEKTIVLWSVLCALFWAYRLFSSIYKMG